MTRELIIKIVIYLILFLTIVFVGTFCTTINVKVEADGACYIEEVKR